MAELLVAGDWTIPGPLARYLREALPDGYFVVAEPVLGHCVLDAVVVGPGCVTMLEVEDDGDGQSGQGGAPGKADSPARPASQALGVFLRDEFPALRPAVRYLHVRRDGAGAGWQVVEPGNMTATRVEESILAAGQAEADAEPAGAQNGDGTWGELAAALCERRLTASMRAGQPFVFRSGGGVKAWSIREAVAHMDRHPEDGIYHLRNGTLGRWLAAEGAGHLAALAQRAVQEHPGDRRAALESFLLGTGLVERPRPALRPEAVDLGYVPAGERASGTFSLARGRGRGYLFGTLEPGESWLDVEPRAFAGGPVEVTVHASTDALPIGEDAQQGTIYINCNAAEAPVAVPVRIRVMPAPARAERYLGRPVPAALAAGAIGAAAGWALGWAMARGAAGTWAAICGLSWALAGLVRGLAQPAAWPAGYAMRRWLGRTARWAAALAVAGAAAAAYWGLALGADLPMPWAAWPVGGAALGGLIGTLHETWAARRQQAPGQIRPANQRRRRVPALIVGLVALAILLAGAPLLRPAWAGLRARGTVDDVQARIEAAWAALNTAADEALEWVYLRYYGYEEN